MCKYWDILHPIFVDRTSSRPKFPADNRGSTSEGDLRRDDTIEGDEEDDSRSTSAITEEDDSASNTLTKIIDNGKKPLKLGKSKRSQLMKGNLAEAILAGSTAREERELEALEFEKRRWEEELEERKRKREDELEERRQRRKLEEEKAEKEHELSLKKLDAKKMLAKAALIKSLKDIGMSSEDIMMELKRL